MGHFKGTKGTFLEYYVTSIAMSITHLGSVVGQSIFLISSRRKSKGHSSRINEILAKALKLSSQFDARICFALMQTIATPIPK
jgi:hypothetical protein